MCEDFRAGVTPALSRTLLSLSSIPSTPSSTSEEEKGGSEEETSLRRDMKVIAPFVACGDLRYVCLH